MNMREKIYVKKVHLWLTQEQWEKLKEDAERLDLKQIEVIRRAIERKYSYVSYLLNLIMLVRNQGKLLNQIARHCNRTRSAGAEILELLRKIEAGNQDIVKGIEKL